MRRPQQIPPRPTPTPSRGSIRDRYKDSTDRQEEEVRKRPVGRTKERKLRWAELAQLRLLACRLQLFWSSRSAARWSLEFLYLQPCLAFAGRHPSHQIVARGRRYRD